MRPDPIQLRAHHLPEGPFALLSMELLVPLGRAVLPGRSVLAPLLEPTP